MCCQMMESRQKANMADCRTSRDLSCSEISPSERSPNRTRKPISQRQRQRQHQLRFLPQLQSQTQRPARKKTQNPHAPNPHLQYQQLPSHHLRPPRPNQTRSPPPPPPTRKETTSPTPTPPPTPHHQTKTPQPTSPRQKTPTTTTSRPSSQACRTTPTALRPTTARARETLISRYSVLIQGGKMLVMRGRGSRISGTLILRRSLGLGALVPAERAGEIWARRICLGMLMGLLGLGMGMPVGGL